MIVVTGATGNLGSQIVERLLERVPAREVGVSVRDPEKATSFARRGVRVRRGDFADPGTLESAFKGASKVLVVSVDKIGEEGVAQSTAAIDAAYRAGADRVLYTSHQAASPDSLFAPARDHAAVEAHLEKQGRSYASIRNGYYTASLQFHLGDAEQTGELAAPADGPVSWTDRADLAEAAAVLLAADGGCEGPTQPLTATKAVDLAGVAASLSELSGRVIRRIVVEDEEFVKGRIEHGMPEAFASLFLGTYLASRRGEFAVTDPTLKTVLGREPQTVRNALERDVAAHNKS
jgi:uncharacterized protein YbjT (DUF2867 family)